MSYVRPFTVRGGTGSGTHPSPCWTSRGTRSSAPDRMKTSDSSASLYCGRPLSVLRVTEASDKLHPKPNGPLPEPESYESVSCGPNRERAGLVASGTVIEPEPVTGLAANFSPMPRMAPPPLGSEIAGGVKDPSLAGEDSDVSSVLVHAGVEGVGGTYVGLRRSEVS